MHIICIYIASTQWKTTHVQTERWEKEQEEEKRQSAHYSNRRRGTRGFRFVVWWTRYKRGTRDQTLHARIYRHACKIIRALELHLKNKINGEYKCLKKLKPKISKEKSNHARKLFQCSRASWKKLKKRSKKQPNSYLYELSRQVPSGSRLSHLHKSKTSGFIKSRTFCFYIIKQANSFAAWFRWCDIACRAPVSRKE